MTDDRPVDVALLRQFSPLDDLKKDNLSALARKARVGELPSGRQLFRQGDTDNRMLWLVSGRIELSSAEGPAVIVAAGSSEARHPLSPQRPRQHSARALDDVEYLALDGELLDVMITWDQTGTYEVAELRSAAEDEGGAVDWMTTMMMQNQALHRIPPANIQAIFLRMQRLAFRAGEVVIRQGAEGDYFYAVVSGRCAVTRETPLNRDGVRLAELGPGDTFGEEALLSESRRNASVTMLTDGVLMRLGKEDFHELMNEPLLQRVPYAEARRMVEAGAVWLDVRLPSEHQNLAIEGSVNLPLYVIRMKLSSLDPTCRYVVYCDTGRRSSAAAYILLERGIEAVVLEGGMAGVESGLRRATGA